MVPMNHSNLVGPIFPGCSRTAADTCFIICIVSFEKRIQSVPNNTYHRNLSVDPSNKRKRCQLTPMLARSRTPKPEKHPKSVKWAPWPQNTPSRAWLGSLQTQPLPSQFHHSPSQTWKGPFCAWVSLCRRPFWGNCSTHCMGSLRSNKNLSDH